MSNKFDLCITGARVIDYESKIDKVLNIGIIGNKIEAITNEDLRATKYINADNYILSPGFIDIHCHEDDLNTNGTGEELPIQTAECAMKSGCTTIVTGNCGLSNHPINNYYKNIKEAEILINCYTYIGNCTLRYLVGLDNYKNANMEQICQMKILAEEALNDGAIGISFGLQYAPGTTFEELVALFEVAAKRNKIVAVHMRYDYSEKATEAVMEVVKAAELTSVSLQISHLSANVYGDNNIEKVTEIINHSSANISADVYPYNVWATSIKSAVFDDGFINFNFNVEDLEILSGDLAGKNCTEELFNRLRQAENDTNVACHNAMPIIDVERAYKLPFVFVGSDGQMKKYKDGTIKGHPRGSGSQAKFLREFVREKKLINLMDAISKLTYLPAKKCNFKNKGSIKVGYDADITIFDFNEITEMSSFGQNNCAIPPKGIKYVISGGKVVYR